MSVLPRRPAAVPRELERRESRDAWAAAGGHTAQAVGLIAALCLAAVLYRPWRPEPFAIGDFSDFLPLLRHGAGFGDTLGRFVAYYAGHGRFNVLQYAALVAKWRLFHADTALWQLTRGAEMLGVVVGACALAVRLGVRPVPAMLGAGLLLCGSGASACWVWLNFGEPLSMVLLLAAALCAVRYQAARHWLVLALSVALCCAAVVLTKEALVVTVPFVVALAFRDERTGRWRRPSPSRRRDVVLLGLTAAAVALALVPVAATLRHAPSGGYTSNYNASHWGLGPAIRLLVAMLLPINLTAAVPAPLRGVALLTDTLFAAIVAAGWLALARTRGRGALAPFLVAAYLPAALTAVYLPWGGTLPPYFLPALLGQALLAGFALGGIGELVPAARLGAAAALSCCLLGCAVLAHYENRYWGARREVDAEVAALVHRVAAREPMVVAQAAVRIPRPPNQWVGKGPVLRRHAIALYDGDLLPVTDVDCGLLPALRKQGIAVVTYAPDCGPVAGAAVVVRRYFPYFDVARRRIGTDSVRADLLLSARSPWREVAARRSDGRPPGPPRHRSCSTARREGPTPSVTADRLATTTLRPPDTAMSSSSSPNPDSNRQSFEDDQRDLNPHRDEERQHATDVIESQLRRRGIRVAGDESSDEAADLLSAVERFEAAVSALGGDRFVNDPRSNDPEEKRFVIPARKGDERAGDYASRILEAAERLGFSA